MSWFRSLFWKIFLAIWLSSIVMLAATVLVVSQMSEREKIHSWLIESVQLNAEQLVEEYERFDGLSNRRQRFYYFRFKRSFYSRWDDHERSDRRRDRYDYDRDDDHDHDRGGWFKKRFPKPEPPRIRIYDLENEQRIYGGPPKHRREAKPLKLEISSESGRNYRVEIAPLESDSSFRHLFRFFVSYQIVVILLASALASILLTWLIVRPLNRLQAHTRDLHQGDLSSRAGEKLSRRRDEIGELAREFNHMADYVEQTLVGGQKLLQDVSHELRAPLARLQVAAGLAEQKLGEDDRLAIRINQECDQLNRLIDEILSLSRLDAQPLDDDSYDLAELLAELHDDIRFTAPERPLFWPEAGQVRLQLPGNRGLLQRALNNVLTNALRHTPERAALHLAVKQKKGQVVLTFRDEGPGVEEALLSQLFEPFVRADSKGDGYGLGLSIARRAVERLKGQISLRNHPEGGLEVMIRLPL